MDRNEILREILSDPEIMERYDIKESEIKSLTTAPPYRKKIIEALSVVINENDNHLSSQRIYTKIKNIYNIG